MRKTILFLIIAIGLAAYVYFYEIKGGEQRQKEKEKAEKLFDFPKDSINYLAIHSPKGSYVFEKDGKWRIKEPLETEADESNINTLLATLTSAKKQRTFSIKADQKSSYGLGSRALTIQFKSANGPRQVVRLGDNTSIGSNLYASKSDTLVHLIANTIRNQADKSLFDWRDKSVVHFDRNKVRELRLHNPAADFLFVKEGSDWTIKEPIQTKAENAKVNELLNKLQNGKIKSVAAEKSSQLEKFGLSKPAYRTALFLGQEKSKAEVMFSSLKGNKAFGKDGVRPHVYTVDSTFLKPFRYRLFDFRDKKFCKFESAPADSMSLFYKDSLLSFVKDSTNNWSLSSGQKTKSWQVRNILSTLNNLQAKKFVAEKAGSLKRYGLQKPRGCLQVFAGKKKLCQLDTGREKDKLVFARSSLSPAVVLIDSEKLERLFPKKADLLEKADH